MLDRATQRRERRFDLIGHCDPVLLGVLARTRHTLCQPSSCEKAVIYQVTRLVSSSATVSTIRAPSRSHALRGAAR